MALALVGFVVASVLALVESTQKLRTAGIIFAWLIGGVAVMAGVGLLAISTPGEIAGRAAFEVGVLAGLLGAIRQYSASRKAKRSESTSKAGTTPPLS